MRVQAKVHLGGLSTDDIEVQIYHGPLDSHWNIQDFHTVPMIPKKEESGRNWIYEGDVSCSASGRHGYKIRVVPKHQNLGNPFEPGLIHWA